MGSKLKIKEKNEIGNQGEHSTRIDTKIVKLMNNEHECSVNLAPPIIMKRSTKYTRKLPEIMEGTTFGPNKRYPKRRKIEDSKGHFMKSNHLGLFNVQYLTKNDINIFRKLKYKNKMYNSKSQKIPSQFSKFNPEIVLDFIKHPTIDKISKLLDLMFIESILFKKHAIDLIKSEKSRKMSIDLKKYLFELCYQKFCELWLHKTRKISSHSPKKFKRFILALLRHTICRTTMCNMSLKKLILYNGSLTGYPKKPHLVLCINIICSFFTNISRKCCRMICMEYKKKAYCKNYKKQVSSIQLYHKGTTKRKDFLEIINEYKQLMQVNRLSAYQVADIKHAYERILEPGQCIDKADLEICANENYDFNRFQDGTKTNHTVISEDLNTINNDDFDFDDIDKTSNSLEKAFYSCLTLETKTDFKAEKFLKHKVEFFKELQFRFNTIPKDDKNNMKTTKDNWKNSPIEAIEKEVHIQYTSNDDHNIENETRRHSSREVKPFIDCLEQKRTTIVDQHMNISASNLKGTTSASYSGEGTSTYLELERSTNTFQLLSISSNNRSRISERFKNKLLIYPIKLNKLEKRTLSIIMHADINIYKINWKMYSPCSRRRLFQMILYFVNFKVALCDKLNLNCLGLREKNICNMIDIGRLLQSIEVESCLSQEYFTFTEIEKFLIWPLGKVIVSNIISQRSPAIDILFSFVKNVMTKCCKKVKDFLQKSGLRIVLNKESPFESLSNVPIGQDVHNTTLSLKYAHAHAQLSHSANNDLPQSSNSEHFCVTNTGFYMKKNSSNEELCKSMVDIFKSDDSIHQSWKECNNSSSFIYRLLKAGVTLPIEESNTEQGSKFVEVYIRWFCGEYLQDDKFYKLAVMIFKNIFLYINTANGFTDIKVEAAINNALKILYDQPCFAKAYKSYLNTKYSKCLSSSKHNSTNDTENRSFLKGDNRRGNEELQTEPNVNVQINPIDTNDVGMSSVTFNVFTSNELDVLNNDIINNLSTSNTRSVDDDFETLHFEHFFYGDNDIIQNDMDENSLCSSHAINGLDFGTDGPNYNNQLFNEDCPFEDSISLNSSYNNLPYSEKCLPSVELETNSEFQQPRNIKDLSPITLLEPCIKYEVNELSNEELSTPFQQQVITDEGSNTTFNLIDFDLSDQINPKDLIPLTEIECGFDNAPVLMSPEY